MKRGFLAIILILFTILLISAACTIQLPTYKPESPKCCMVKDVSNNQVLSCVNGLKEDVECNQYFSKQGNVQFVNQNCESLTECSNKLLCFQDGNIYQEDYIFCSENKLYQCKGGNILNIDDSLNEMIFNNYGIENAMKNCCIEFDDGIDYSNKGGIVCFNK